ncbi:MAG TPA: ABC transporter permease [Candidatus Acidoferrales bacterium]|nr:ABC transporter permease [Candidatus Acidoferrales bacterium]
MRTFWQDVRYGWRILQRNRGFAVVAALTLAIGIGANAAIFSAVDAFLLRPLPYPHPGRIVMVWNTDPNRKVVRGTASLAEFLDWREMNHVFEEIGAWRPSFVTITGGREAQQVWCSHVTTNFFHLLGTRTILGREFLPEEEQLGHEKVAIMSYALWRQRFGSDPAVVGKSMVLDYEPYQIVGVLPRNFSLFGTGAALDLWVPLAFNRAQLDRRHYDLVVFGRMKPGVTVRQAQADIVTVVSALKKQYPEMDQNEGTMIETLHASLTHGVRPALLIFLWAVAFVLLIACANVANLMLARAASREREIALRSALGAGSRRILRQLLTESTLLAVIGGALGVIVAFGGIRFIHAALPEGAHQIPFSDGMGLNGPVLAFTIGLSLLTGIIFGLAPALQISHSSLGESLKEGSRGSTSGRRSHLLRSSLVVSEVALSLLLLVGASLLVRSFIRLMSQNLGFNPSNALTMQIWLPGDHYSQPGQVTNFYQQALDRIRALPGVKAASAVDFLMFTGWSDYLDFDIAGRSPGPSGDQFTSRYRVVDWQYLRTMGIRILSGRDFAPSDGPNSAGVALIDKALAERYWPNEDPVGKQIRLHVVSTRAPWQALQRDGWLTIVGVVDNIQEWDWGVDAIPTIYLPLQQDPSWLMSIVIRENGKTEPIVPAVRRIVSSLDSNQPVANVHMLNEMLADALADRRLNAVLLAIFAAVAVVLAAVGIYGVMAYAVSQRTHEIGIRMALGAEPRDVLRMIVREGMILTGMGMLIGLVSAVMVALYLRGHLYGVQLYGIRAIDPVTFIGVPILIGLVAALASYLPARRATRVDPLIALRYE